LVCQHPFLEEIMDIIGWLITGLIVGALARFFVPGPTDFRGCLPTIALGILGAAVGGWIGRSLDIAGWRFVLSILGAVLVLVIYQGIVGRKTP
jgi:uncharacterized membrane protein YeaQ/YmgE (transglycosylase-associated protein family)